MADDPLRNQLDVLHPSHFVGAINESRERMIVAVPANLLRVLSDQSSTDVVNGGAGIPRR